MAGMKCPKCGKSTLFETPLGRKCSNCGCTVTSVPNGGKGGKGQKCMICGKMTVFNGKCSKCGAKVS